MASIDEAKALTETNITATGDEARSVTPTYGLVVHGVCAKLTNQKQAILNFTEEKQRLREHAK
jgi:hypothetical protein